MNTRNAPHTLAALILLAILGQGLPATAQVNAADLQWQSAADLQKVGEAKLSVLFWDVYYSRLYTDSGSYQRGQRPLKLEIEYLLDIKSAALVDRTRKEWDDQGLSHENQEQWLTQLLELWPDVAQNDVLVLELDASNRSRFVHNGQPLGIIEDPDFGQHFVDIWLAPTTTRPKLRLTLIGEEDS